MTAISTYAKPDTVLRLEVVDRDLVRRLRADHDEIREAALLILAAETLKTRVKGVIPREDRPRLLAAVARADRAEVEAIADKLIAALKDA